MGIRPDKLCSDSYREQLRELAEAGKWAGSGERYAPEVWWLATKLRCRSLLDYGCGPGKLKGALSGIPLEVSEYDPGVSGRDSLPMPADLVACTDVLEHVEPERINFVLRHIYQLARKGAYFVIAVRPADKRLPDGRNAHLIIDNARWWYNKLDELSWRVNLLQGCVIDNDNAHFWTQK